MTVDTEFSTFNATAEAKQKVDLDKAPKPSFFNMRSPLLKQGRDAVSLPSSENLWMKVKVYASGGENGLHMHPYQDHSFVILQGSARFHGPKGEERELKRHEGIFLPAGSFYWFEATSQENLVLLRIGALTGDRHKNRDYRVNTNGEWVDPKSEENKTVQVIVDEGKYFE